jgi:hypothetical protein
MTVSVLAVFFVDDGIRGINDAKEASPSLLPDLLDIAEKSTQSRDRLLFASSEALEVTKFSLVLSNGAARHTENIGCWIPMSSKGDHFCGPLGLTHNGTSSYLRITLGLWKPMTSFVAYQAVLMKFLKRVRTSVL